VKVLKIGFVGTQTDQPAAMVDFFERTLALRPMHGGDDMWAFRLPDGSIAEGFGLTVAEAMWKAKPVVASRIGGIQDQIVDDESGLLIEDPTDLVATAAAIDGLLADPVRAAAMGAAARERVRSSMPVVEAVMGGLSGAPRGIERLNDKGPVWCRPFREYGRYEPARLARKRRAAQFRPAM